MHNLIQNKLNVHSCKNLSCSCTALEAVSVTSPSPKPTPLRIASRILEAICTGVAWFGSEVETMDTLTWYDTLHPLISIPQVWGDDELPHLPALHTTEQFSQQWEWATVHPVVVRLTLHTFQSDLHPILWTDRHFN